MNEVLDMSDDEGKVLLNSIFKVILLMYKYQGKTCLCNLKRDKFFKISAWVTFAFVAGISEYFSTVLSLLDFPLFFFYCQWKILCCFYFFWVIQKKKPAVVLQPVCLFVYFLFDNWKVCFRHCNPPKQHIFFPLLSQNFRLLSKIYEFHISTITLTSKFESKLWLDIQSCAWLETLFWYFQCNKWN